MMLCSGEGLREWEGHFVCILVGFNERRVHGRQVALRIVWEGRQEGGVRVEYLGRKTAGGDGVISTGIDRISI
jgi:hypothetical protein